MVPGNTYHFRVFTCNEGSVPTNFAAATQATAAGLLSGIKSICPTGCDYTSIGNACNDIRSKGVDGALILELMSTYAPSVETYPLVFGNLLTNSSNTITLRAHSGVSSPIRFFSTASSTFVFNNTNYLSIDGLLGGSGRPETIQIGNNSSNGSAVQFINGATNNNISNCRITGNAVSIGSGIIGFLGTNTTEGNNYNSISNCSIKDTLGQAIYCVYSLGNTNVPNLYNSIFNNYIYNYYNSSNPSYGVF
ncbi:MAG: hypothetical protein Q8R57_06835, partial [Bacteroidota bacterium]|nr:hypothetical protein [Bacteroidota bacterium]